MKRMLLSTVTASVLALAVPGMASAAQSSKSHHRAHHSRTHSRHHVVAHPRVLTFGTAAASTPAAGAPTGSPGTPGTPTPTPTPPADGSGETAGTVLSFTNGVLTITLTNGTTVSGQVTEQTEIHCQPATPPSTGGEDQGEGEEGAQGEGSGSGDSQHMRSDGLRPGSGQQGTEGDSGSGSDGQGSGDGQQTCTSAALVPGAIVREAELSVEGSGAVWDHIDLVQ